MNEIITAAPPAPQPTWLTAKGINEVDFCQQFRRQHDVICIGGSFFSEEGHISDPGQIRKWIYQMLCPHVTSNIARKVDILYQALRLDSADGGKLNDSLWVIHTANGTMNVATEEFKDYRHYCRHRLPVAYNSAAGTPTRWLSFLEELLEPEDILTLQEYLGYCLIPCTIAQKMLIITGQGGEGKSRIGVVMKAILGNAMCMGSLNKIETNRFARADLEHKLLMVDDDLKLSALPDTNYIKSIITAETPTDLERKGEQSYQGLLYARFLAFGNDTLQALHDRSYGFFRRQIILTAKPRRPDRVDDPLLVGSLIQEKEAIFSWCLEGLNRLICNDFRFTLSSSAKANSQQSMESGNNMLAFLKSEGYIHFNTDLVISSRQLYDIYRRWCDDNALVPLSAKTFWSFLTQNAPQYGLRPTSHVPIGGGKQARGFYGIGGAIHL